MIWKRIFGAIALALVVSVIARGLITRHERLTADQVPALVPQPAAVIETPKPMANKPQQNPTPAPAAPAAPSASPVLAAVGSHETDGKEVLAANDGKETLPDGKEALPPVGELVGNRSQSVNPAQNGPPLEYLNKNSNGNPLLTPPNPVNVNGPVVSQDTKGQTF